MSSPGGSGTIRVLPVTVLPVSCESTTTSTTCTGNHDDVSGVSRASHSDFEETRVKDSVSLRSILSRGRLDFRVV